MIFITLGSDPPLPESDIKIFLEHFLKNMSFSWILSKDVVLQY